jgi:precorrin-6Y C5,15-methyltransferase (decarboxylating)
MVVHVATIENLSATCAVLRRVAGEVRALLVHVARGVEQLESLRFESLNPTYLLAVGKPPAP